MTQPEQTNTAASAALAGALCMLLAIVAMSSMDVVGKFIVQADIPVFQMLLLRGAIVLTIIFAWITMRNGLRALSTPKLGIYFLRALITFLAPVGFFTGLKTLPLADAVVLFFGAPLFMTALAVPLFKEQVGWRRWVSILVGFGGVLIALKPGTDSFRPEGLLIIGASIAYALSMLSARWLGKDEPLTNIVFYNNLGMTILCGFAIVISPMVVVDFVSWVWFDNQFLVFIGLMAIFSLVGHFLMTRAFIIAPISVIAPMEYTGVIWSAAFGYLFWSEIPELNTWIGGIIIVCAGLYNLHRERVRGRIITEPEAKATGDIIA